MKARLAAQSTVRVVCNEKRKKRLPAGQRNKPKSERKRKGPKKMSIPNVSVTRIAPNVSVTRIAPISEPESPREMINRMHEAVFGVPLDAPRPPPKSAAPEVTWDDVCGQTKAKAAMREAIELPIKHADVYRRFGRKPSKGVLLYGPPGNGKTLLAKAAANAIAKLYGDKPTRARGFISVKGPELLASYVGETEEKIRRLFREAAVHKQEVGFPGVIFIDEAEALLSARGSSYPYMDGFVQQFLTEMDGFTDSSAIIILATNRPNVLDPAIVRDGRIDRRIYVGPPAREDAAEIFRMNLRNRPLMGGIHEIVSRATAALFDPKHVLYRVHVHEEAPQTIALHNVTSGAQVAGIVERATSRAIARAIAGGSEGIEAGDIEAEVQGTLEESRALSHKDEILNFVQGMKWTIVERVSANDLATPVMRMPVSPAGAN